MQYRWNLPEIERIDQIINKAKEEFPGQCSQYQWDNWENFNDRIRLGVIALTLKKLGISFIELRERMKVTPSAITQAKSKVSKARHKEFKVKVNNFIGQYI